MRVYTPIKHFHLYSLNEYDRDGDISESGIYLHFRNTRIKVADDIASFEGFIKHLSAMIPEMICEYEREIADLQKEVARLYALTVEKDREIEELKAENNRLKAGLERISRYDSYHDEWPNDIFINAPPEELATFILMGDDYPTESVTEEKP